MRYKTLFKSGLLILTILMLLASCDKDFNEIGSDIIGDNHFGFELYSDATVNAFTQGTDAVQSNNLPLNSLGIYNNPVFGNTKAGFVSQLQMAAPNPTFDPAYFVSMDSVVLSVPYFSHVDPNDSSKNVLDSINGSGPIDLKVFESGYYLSDLDPSSNFQESQKYFTSQESVFNSKKIGNQLNDSSDPKENSSFEPSSKNRIIFSRNDSLGLVKSSNNISQSLSPRMALHLNKDFFYSKILKGSSGNLINNSEFKNYFRGIYFQVSNASANPNNGTLMRLNFTKGDITLYYTEYYGFNDPDTKTDPIKYDHDHNPKTPDVPKKVIKSFVLNMQGNTVNLMDHEPAGGYAGIIAPRPLDPLPGDKNLYIKGGAGGSAAIIDLFGPDNNGNLIADELEQIRNNGWLINEANLTFFVDKDKMSGAPEPGRIFLYDVNNRRPIIDYSTDVTTNANPKLNKSVLGGIIETKDGRGYKYKVRITNHVRNLVKYADSTNVRLGLVVTESVGILGNAMLQKPIDIPYPIKTKNARVFDRVPVSSVMNPLGTILFGTNIPTDDPNYDKRLKLEIYYTKPKK